MLNSIALKVSNGSIVHFNGDIDHQNALGVFEGFDPALQMPQVGRNAIHLLKKDAPGTNLVGIQI